MNRPRSFPTPRAEVLALRSVSRDHSKAARTERRAEMREMAAMFVARELERAADRLEMVVAIRDAAVTQHAKLTDPLTAACAIIAKGHRMVPADVVRIRERARVVAEAHFDDDDAARADEQARAA